MFGGSFQPLPEPMDNYQLLIVAAGYVLLMLTSGFPVKYAIGYITDSDDTAPSEELSRAGRVVGKCENFLTLTFVFAGAYTGLAVIFAAEGIITREFDDDFYPVYVLAGTLVNFSYSILFAFLILGVIAVT